MQMGIKGCAQLLWSTLGAERGRALEINFLAG